MTTSDITFTSWHPRTLYNELDGTQAQPDELREQARNEGYAEGYDQGFEAGKQESIETAKAQVVMLQSLIDALDQPFSQIELEVSEYLLSLVSLICKAVIFRELSTDPHHIQITLNRALELLSEEKGNVYLTVHPDDMAVVSDHWSDELGVLKIIPSSEISRGGCRIKRNDSLVDATIESQLRKIILDLALVPGPNKSSGEPSDPLDATNVDTVTKRLEDGFNLDE